MDDRDERIPQGQSVDDSLGKAVVEISERATLLIHEEVELAKAEVSSKISRMGRGAAVGAAAGIFVLLGVFALVNALGFGLYAFFGDLWLGFLVLGGIMLVLAGIAGFAASRLFKDSSPVPTMAIDEARKTKEMIGSRN